MLILVGGMGVEQRKGRILKAFLIKGLYLLQISHKIFSSHTEEFRHRNFLAKKPRPSFTYLKNLPEINLFLIRSYLDSTCYNQTLHKIRYNEDSIKLWPKSRKTFSLIHFVKAGSFLFLVLECCQRERQFFSECVNSGENQGYHSWSLCRSPGAPM